MSKFLLLLSFCKFCYSNINDINYPPNLVNPNANFDEFELKYLNKNIILYLDFDDNNLHEETIKLFHYYGNVINDCGIYTYFIKCKFNNVQQQLYTQNEIPRLQYATINNCPYNNQLQPIFKNVCDRHKQDGYYTYNKKGNIIKNKLNHRQDINWPNMKLTDRFNCNNQTFILKSKLYELENYNKYLNASLNNYKNNTIIYINYNYNNNYLQIFLIIILIVNFCCNFNYYNVIY